MVTSIELITPEIAAKYLEKNTSNFRPLKKHYVQQYADDIRAGNWQFNGESIKFYNDGTLADGQHRLQAVVLSGLPITSFVVRGVPNDVDYFDGGANRTTRDYLQRLVDPVLRENSAVGAAKIVMRGNFDAVRVSRIAVRDFILDNADTLADATVLARRGALKCVGKKAAVCAAAFCLLECGADRQTLKDFFEVVNTGFPNPEYECSPAIVLRNYLISDGSGKSTTKSRRLQFSMTMEAYRDFVLFKHRSRPYKESNAAMDMLKAVSARTTRDTYTLADRSA